MRVCGPAGGHSRIAFVLIGTIAMLVCTAGPAPAATVSDADGGSPATSSNASGGSAATLSVGKACYVNRSRSEPASMTVSGSGFAPEGQVHISSADGSVHLTLTASATGDIAATTSAPTPAFALPGAKTVTLTAQEPAAPATPVTATTTVTVAPLSVAVQPGQLQVTKKVTWYFSGFDGGKPIYGHYLRAKQVALVRFGRANGPCGVLKTRALLFPGGHPVYRRYGLQIDDSQRYTRHAFPRLNKTLEFLLVPATAG